jgi:hypothetical protein
LEALVWFGYSGLGLGVLCLGFGVSVLVRFLGFKVSGLTLLRVSGLVWFLGFGVSGLVLRVWGVLFGLLLGV